MLPCSRFPQRSSEDALLIKGVSRSTSGTHRSITGESPERHCRRGQSADDAAALCRAWGLILAIPAPTIRRPKMLIWLREPRLKGLTPGSPDFFNVQRQLIFNRPLIKRCYDDWYRRLLGDTRSAPAQGAILELGSGGSCLQNLEPAIVTSDVVPGIAERVVDGRRLPFADGTLRALLMTHVFHHIPDVDAFFKEAQRALVPGGVISMIEVAHTPFARFFFRHFHHEPYEDACQEWSFAQRDSMMDSNQALSWMVFVGDRSLFERQYPGLIIEKLARSEERRVGKEGRSR